MSLLSYKDIREHSNNIYPLFDPFYLHHIIVSLTSFSTQITI